MAAISPFSIFLLSLLTLTGDVLSDDYTTTSLYLSPKTTFSNYDKMLQSFKIFIYAPPPSTAPTLFTTKPESQFYTSLLRSRFITQDPSQAHLFFVPFPSSISVRSLARLIRNIRLTFPFWNRTLGADHFYLSAAGVDSSSDRNIVELKKNSIQISCFPTSSGLFIPHKDVTLPPVHSFTATKLTPSINGTTEYLGYMKVTDRTPVRSIEAIIEEISNHPDFKVEFEYDQTEKNEKKEKDVQFTKSRRFCIFMYGSDMSWMVEAMALRCVPVVITDRPVQDLPLMDVINWAEMAVFVGAGGGVRGLRRVLDGIEKERYERMVGYGVTAVQHLGWNAEPQTHDAFHMVVYQLWLRRHTVRYARWVEQ